MEALLMKLPPLLQKALRWDDFQRFHYRVVHEHHGMDCITFPETGETIGWAAPQGDVALRRDRHHLALSNLATTDDRLWDQWTLTTPDGVPCTRAMLTQKGLQILWIDHTHGIAVNGGARLMYRDRSQTVDGAATAAVRYWPAFVRQRQPAIYYPDSQGPPQGAYGLLVSRARTLTKDERATVRATVEACRAWAHTHPEIAEVNTGPEGITVPYLALRDPRSPLRQVLHRMQSRYDLALYCPAEDRHGCDVVTLLTTPFAALHAYYRIQVVLHGVYHSRVETRYDWLRATPKTPNTNVEG